MAFRQATQGQWNPIVQAISRSWSFGGTVSDVQVSSPDVIEQPFDVQYAYTRTGYPNWPDAIGMPLPAINFAELPKEAKESTSPIRLEAPGKYLLDAKIRLPENLVPQLPAAVSVEKDFAEYHATYTWAGGVLHVVRKLTIHMRDIPRARSDDYVAFRKAVSEDESRLMTLSSSTPAHSVILQGKKNSRAEGAPAESARVQGLIDLGNTLSNQNNLEGAITEYRKALQLDSSSYLAHRYLGDALKSKGEYQEAAAEYRAALLLNPNGADAHVGLGNALYGINDMTGAGAEYRRALQLEPDNAYAHYDLGLVLDSQHKLDAAIAEYRTAVRLNPGDADAHYSMGVDLEQQRNLPGAVAEYRAALRYEPDSPDTEDKLGRDLILLGHPAEGSEELKKAITAVPGHASDYAMLGTAYAAMHRNDEALAEWKHAEELKPSSLAASNIALILIGQKRYAGAIAELNAAVSKDPNNQTLISLLAKAEIDSGDREKGVADLQIAEDVILLRIVSSHAPLDALDAATLHTFCVFPHPARRH